MVALFVFAVILAVFCSGNIRQNLFAETSYNLNQGWQDRQGNAVTLPQKLSGEQVAPYAYTLTLPQISFESRPVLLIWGKYMCNKVYLDDEQIASFSCLPEGARHSVGKIYHFVRLPENFAGRTLRVEGEPQIGKAVNYEIAAPILGSKSQILYDGVRRELPLLLTVLVTMCFGMLLFLFSFQARGTADGAMFFHTGLFAIVFSLYSLSISESIYFCISNPYVIYVMEFMTLMALPIPLLLILKDRCTPQYRRLLWINAMVLMTNMIVQTIINFTTSMEFRKMVLATHLLMVLTLVLMCVTVLVGSKTKDLRKEMLITFSPIFLGTVLNMAMFYLPGVNQKATLFQLGVFLFVLLQALDLIRSYFTAREESLKMHLYQHMAYTDALTGLRNRTAFEERIATLDKEPVHGSLWCLCADINDLKQVNDQQGHSWGDELIRAAASCLLEALPKGAILYRTGGDEFVAFMENKSAQEMKHMERALGQATARYNKLDRITLGIATGYDRLEIERQEQISELLLRVDQKMYEDKWKTKSVQQKKKSSASQ